MKQLNFTRLLRDDVEVFWSLGYVPVSRKSHSGTEVLVMGGSFSIEIEDGRKYCVERVEATEFIKGDENAAA